MCCTRLAEIQDAKKSPKLPSGHHRTTSSGYIFATKVRIDNRKKLVKQQTSFTCPYNIVNFGPLVAEILSLVWGTPAHQRVSRLGSVTVQHLGVSQTLRRWTEGATYVRQGDHHVGHWPAFLVYTCFELFNVLDGRIPPQFSVPGQYFNSER